MAIIKIKDKVFHAKPLWEEYLESTDFTSDIHPMLYRYYINDVEVTKERFEEEYKLALNNIVEV